MNEPRRLTKEKKYEEEELGRRDTAATAQARLRTNEGGSRLKPFPSANPKLIKTPSYR